MFFSTIFSQASWRQTLYMHCSVHPRKPLISPHHPPHRRGPLAARLSAWTMCPHLLLGIHHQAAQEQSQGLQLSIMQHLHHQTTDHQPPMILLQPPKKIQLYNIYIYMYKFDINKINTFKKTNYIQGT